MQAGRERRKSNSPQTRTSRLSVNASFRNLTKFLLITNIFKLSSIIRAEKNELYAKYILVLDAATTDEARWLDRLWFVAL